jgi:DNA-binding beta-propeller fold protein YncE
MVLGEVQMIFSRAIRLGSLAALFLACLSCGDTFRPVAIPISPNPPNPATFHYVISLSTNGPFDPGASTRIDVSGDSNAGVAQLGVGPVHAAIVPSGNTIYVANQTESSVSWYAPGNPAAVGTVSLPAGSAPAFVTAADNAKVYVANSGTGTVAAITTGSNIAQVVPLDPNPTVAAGYKPVAVVETPDAQKVYAINNGQNSVSVITTSDLLAHAPISLLNGAAPVWAVVRSDGARVYVLNDSSVGVIDTSTDTLLGSVAVDAGGNYMTYDKTQSRIYITSPSQESITILNASADPGSPNFLVAHIDLSAAAGIPGCPAGCSPTSVTVLSDGTYAYVPAYVLPTGGSTLDSQLLVITAATNLVSKSISLPTATVDATNATGCASTRFRLFTVASADKNRVYISNCDAGGTAILQTSDDTLVQQEQVDPQTCALTTPTLPLMISAPYSSFPPTSVACVGIVPPAQNPVFLLAGP